MPWDEVVNETAAPSVKRLWRIDRMMAQRLVTGNFHQSQERWATEDWDRWDNNPKNTTALPNLYNHYRVLHAGGICGECSWLRMTVDQLLGCRLPQDTRPFPPSAHELIHLSGKNEESRAGYLRRRLPNNAESWTDIMLQHGSMPQHGSPHGDDWWTLARFLVVRWMGMMGLPSTDISCALDYVALGSGDTVLVNTLGRFWISGGLFWLHTGARAPRFGPVDWASALIRNRRRYELMRVLSQNLEWMPPCSHSRHAAEPPDGFGLRLPCWVPRRSRGTNPTPPFLSASGQARTGLNPAAAPAMAVAPLAGSQMTLSGPDSGSFADQSRVNLQVSVQGVAPGVNKNYMWRRNGQAVSKGSASSYSFEMSSDRVGRYDVIVWTSNEVEESAPAIITPAQPAKTQDLQKDSMPTQEAHDRRRSCIDGLRTLRAFRWENVITVAIIGPMRVGKTTIARTWGPYNGRHQSFNPQLLPPTTSRPLTEPKWYEKLESRLSSMSVKAPATKMYEAARNSWQEQGSTARVSVSRIEFHWPDQGNRFALRYGTPTRSGFPIAVLDLPGEWLCEPNKEVQELVFKMLALCDVGVLVSRPTQRLRRLESWLGQVLQQNKGTQRWPRWLHVDNLPAVPHSAQPALNATKTTEQTVGLLVGAGVKRMEVRQATSSCDCKLGTEPVCCLDGTQEVLYEALHLALEI